MKTTKFFLAVAALAIVAFLHDGCKKEENPESTPPPTVEHPPATTVILTLVRLDTLGNPTTDTARCTVRDTSLVHGKPAIEDSLHLHAGQSYKAKFTLFDESVSPTEDITGDIISEQDAHLFRFHPSDTSHVIISNQDLDSHGLIFGLNFRLTVLAGASAHSIVHVVLEHHDDGNKGGTEFDLDLDRDFPISVP